MVTPLQIERDVFDPVAARISQPADSLHEIRKVKGGGIEGWLKVEAVAALGPKIKKVQNSGPDLILTDDNQIELKAGCGLDVAYIRKGMNKYRMPCIFLGYGNPALLETEEIEQVKSHTFSADVDNWVVGLIHMKNTDRSGEQTARAHALPRAALL